MPRSVLTLSSRAARSGLVAVVTGVVLTAGLAAPAVAAVPTAPTGVWGIGYEGAVRLTWVGPDDDGGGAITSYLVTDDLGGSWTLDTENYYRLSSRACRTASPWRFTVTAVNADGPGPASAPSAPGHTARRTRAPAGPRPARCRRPARTPRPSCSAPARCSSSVVPAST